MKHFLALLVWIVLTSAFVSVALGQTDEELRQMYFRQDFAQIEKLAQGGDVRAEAWMGLIMQQAGRRSESKEWWERAAEKGNGWAIDSLARMHLRDKADDKAAYWYRRGAELGYPESQLQLGSLLLQGRGAARNEEEAVRLYKAAAAQGYEYAYFPLARLYAEGRGTARDLVEAYALVEIAEATLDPSQNDGPRAFKSQLAAELSPEQITQATKKARETRPDAFAPQPWWLPVFLLIPLTIVVGTLGVVLAVFIIVFALKAKNWWRPAA